MSTRFGVNIYSYDSDFAIGGEWWVGRRGNRRAEIELSPEARLQIAKHAAIGGRLRDDPEERVVQTISSGRSVEESVREAVAEGVAEATGEAEGKARRDIARAFERQKALERERALLTGDEAQIAAQRRRDAPVAADPNERDGVLKARLSGNWSLALLYERGYASASYRSVLYRTCLGVRGGRFGVWGSRCSISPRRRWDGAVSL